MKRIMNRAFFMFRTILTTCCTLVVAAVALSVPSVEAQSCLSGSQTRQVIASGAVVRLANIASAAQARGYTQLGSASLCGAPGSYVYVVVASTASGASARLTFDAASGALISER